MRWPELAPSVLAAAGAPFLAGNDDLHPTTERADVADDDPVSGLQPIRHLRHTLPLVHCAELHGSDAHRLAIDAIDERPAVVHGLPQCRGGHTENVRERPAGHTAPGERAAPKVATRSRHCTDY